MSSDDRSERFDLCDRNGVLLGRTKSRADVHRDGDWHRALHIWVWARDARGAPQLIFQRRSLQKDSWPGAVDIAVTGHLAAGETVAEALREANEEIGLPLELSDVAPLGRRRRSHAVGAGHADNEVQTILATRTPVDIARLHVSSAEVSAILVVPFMTVGALFSGDVDVVAARRYARSEAGAIAFCPESLSMREFVAAPDGYYARAYGSLAALLAEEEVRPWELG